MSVRPLPERLQAPLWLDAVDLHERLEVAFEGPVDLTLTDNRRSMIRIRRAGERWAVRLHHMFADGDDDVLGAIAELGHQRSEVRTTTARAHIRAFAELHDEKIRRKQPARRVRVRTEGRTHDLGDLMARVQSEHFPHQPMPVEITWGRWGRPGLPVRELRLGSYDPRRRLVRIHPLLDRAAVPAWVVEFVIYHELLHHLIPSRYEGGRIIHHGPRFREREAQHPRYHDYHRWAAQELSGLLDGACPEPA